LRILHLTTHEHSGAGRAVIRIHRALRKAGMDSSVAVLDGTGAEPGVTVLGGAARALGRLQRRLEMALLRAQRAGEPGYRSLALFGVAGDVVRRAGADVVHLHWVPGLLGLRGIASAERPVVWTFHDQWPICGAEHYTALGRPRQGYGERGLDLDAWVWRRKRARWKDFFPRIVCPSGWLAGEVRSSVLFGGRDVRVIPNPLDMALFSPRERSEARRHLGLPAERTLLAFGAWSATSDPRKGFQVLSAALARLAERPSASGLGLVVFGEQGTGRIHGLETYWRGFIDDDAELTQLYSACDALALPSLSDNFPNTALEAMACGLPVVASRAGGIPEIVRDGENGLLAEAGNAAELAQRLESLLADVALRSRLGANARRTVAALCDERTVADSYARVYRAALGTRER
jgi:glycosyltransferase involved in cell wall biosynthesis